MICSASTSRRRPDGVSVIPVGVRSKSITPNCSSSVLMWLESAGWLKMQRLGRPRQVAELRDGNKGAKVIEVHKRNL